jgi:hypothetical protein
MVEQFVMRRAHGVAPDASPADLAAAQTTQRREVRQVRQVRKAPELAAPYVPESERPEGASNFSADPYAQVLEDLQRKAIEIDIAIKAIQALRR